MTRQHFLVGLAFFALLLLPPALGGSILAAPAPPDGPEGGEPAPAAAAPAKEEATEPTAANAADVPLVAEKVRQLMQDRDYPAAIRAIDQAAKAEGAPVGYLTYLKGRAHYLAKDYDLAEAVFDALAKAEPEGPWARRARFGKALALARQGDFRSAELIFRAEAEYLLSPARRQQIADIYLEFADRYFDPPKNELGEQTAAPDYERALEFYEQALDVGPKPEKRVEVELLVARCRQELGQHGQAAGLYERFIEQHADSPLVIEARFRLGECRMAEGNRQAARRAWEDLLAAHAGSDSPRIAEAQYRLAQTWGIPTPGSDEELDLGTAALEKFLKRFPDHELAAAAYLEIARSFLHRSRHEDAVAAFNRFLADPRYQDREEIPDARSLLGTAYLQQGKYEEALATWREYLVEHPAHKDWSAVQRRIIDAEYAKALAKVEAEEYDAANELFAEFLARYPLDPRNPRILLLMNRKFEHEKKWDEAIANWRRLVSKYPQTEEASRAQYRIAVTLETELGKLEEALKEYRKVTSGSAQSDARQAVARLTAKSMRIATERVFRSDETPQLKLTTRNIEKVNVRVYRVDLETYFRKMHLARGVEGLDTALIDPDATFEFAVP
jgi:alpha-2-macroglobulin